MASIIVASGDRRGDHYRLGHRTNIIGRAESLPIQVLDDRVSRKHVQIRFDPEDRALLGGRSGLVRDACPNGPMPDLLVRRGHRRYPAAPESV